MSLPTYAEALLAAQHEALDVAVREGRLSAGAAQISHDLLDDKITEEEARARYEALADEAVTDEFRSV